MTVGAEVRRVLVVDDNTENRLLAQATLEDADIQCVVASSGEEGIAMFLRDQPDCILLDIRMPAPDGIAVCERIRALPDGGAVAILFLTAERNVDTFDRALAAGGDDFITKPFDTAELVARVQTAVRLRKIAIARDDLAAQLKRQRDELQRLQLHKEQLTQFLVHDLKNPVSSIGLQAQRVLRDHGASERSLDAARRIGDDAQRLLRMITNLLDLSRADEGRLVPVRTAIDLPGEVSKIVAEHALRASESQLAIVDEIEPTDVLVDPDLVRRVIANLVENAIRHAPVGSTVNVRSRTTPAGLELWVEDVGTGVPDARRLAVFERFVSSNGSSTNRGLGLAFCKVAIDAHGGRIWIEDNAPGARFCVVIPR